MFDLPDAKRIRRSDLHSRSRSSSPSPSPPDPTLTAHLHSQLARIYGPLPSPSPPPTPDLLSRDQRIAEGSASLNGAQPSPVEEQAFEFRLFSTNPTSSNNKQSSEPQKIVLGDEDAEWGDGAFVVPSRELEYYIASKAEGERKCGFELMALSGEEVLKGRERRAWGLEVPWRVRVLRVQGKVKGKEGAVVVVDAGEEPGDSGKKKQPGKKRRILLRERERNRKRKEEERRVERESKEEAEREKRTRRNREKKVKRKAKEKAKKSSVGPSNGNGDGTAMEGTGEDSIMQGVGAASAAQ